MSIWHLTNSKGLKLNQLTENDFNEINNYNNDIFYLNVSISYFGVVLTICKEWKLPIAIKWIGHLQLYFTRYILDWDKICDNTWQSIWAKLMYITSRCVINYLELKNGRSEVTSVLQSSLKLHLNVYVYIIYRWQQKGMDTM